MIPVLFNILFVFIPLVFFKTTSELFEFNKIIVLYIFTTLIMAVWLYKSIVNRKFIFRRTILDIPLTLYLFTLLLSTLFSIDPRTSVLGYYSRFNGGLISQICYALLYWAFVSNMTVKQSLFAIRCSLFATAIASAMAVAEHFGIFTTCGLMNLGWRESCWVQDVQTRVFSTLGQPNWLAALLVALAPLTWGNLIKNEKLRVKNLWLVTSILFFVTLLFTGSRSGLLAFGVEAIIFWGFMFKKHVKEFLILNFIFLVLFFVFRSPTTVSNGPALETGGTESGTIRKYVWLGALEVFKKNPILGTGPETFAFSFPMYKPIEHNLTSEWDFVYNKAHNEFLNYLANTGILGFISYLALIIYSIFIMFKSGKFEYLAGYIGILITNFFGFSVVPVSLLFFLFPAFAIVQNTKYKVHNNITKLKFNQKIAITLVLIINFYLLSINYHYWLSDIKNHGDTHPSPYNLNIIKSNANLYYKNGNITQAIEIIKSGIKIAPYDPKLYYQMGIYFIKLNDLNKAKVYLNKSVNLKPNYKDARFALGLTYIDLKEFDLAKNELKYILEFIDPKDELTKRYLDEI